MKINYLHKYSSVAQTPLMQRKKSNFVKLAILVTLLILAQTAAAAKVEDSDGGPITTVYTEREKAKSSDYIKDGKTHNWGQGNNLVITGFEYNGNSYGYQAEPSRVVVRRNDNALSNGEPCAVFVERQASTAYDYEPSYPSASGSGKCDAAQIMDGRRLNLGILDLFQNKGRNSNENESSGNIERVDFIIDGGIPAPEDSEALAQSGHIIAEKMATKTKNGKDNEDNEDEVRIAAIIELSTTGEPSKYGPLVNVCAIGGCIFCDASEVNACVTFGKTNINLRTALLANERKAPQTSLEMTRKDKDETIAMAFVALTDLGISVNQRYYGFSLFAPDVTKNHDLADYTTFPTDTMGGGGSGKIPGDADIFGGTASYYSAHACGFH